MNSELLPLLGHTLHVTTWGNPANPALVMWHGLARNGRDFDELAEALSDTYFVMCPDTIGRGKSSWAETPETDYTLPHYVDLALAMLDHFGKDRCIWLGTSMGGQIGISTAFAAPDRIDALLINDIGPEVPDVAMDRIVTYSATLPIFVDLTEAEAWLREVYVPFGPAPDGFWKRMAKCSTREVEGGLTLHYDPRIIAVLDAGRGAMNLWSKYEALTCPTHVLRGATSDLLTKEIADRMEVCGPRADVTVFDDCGHAPSLSRDKDAELVRDLLERLTRN